MKKEQTAFFDESNPDTPPIIIDTLAIDPKTHQKNHNTIITDFNTTFLTVNEQEYQIKVSYEKRDKTYVLYVTPITRSDGWIQEEFGTGKHLNLYRVNRRGKKADETALKIVKDELVYLMINKCKEKGKS